MNPAFRKSLLDMLDAYAREHPDERPCVARIRDLVRARDDCLERTSVPGHITASAWIVSPDHRRFLLTHHRKLNRWLQLGGHVDGEPRLHLAALREAREESGMLEFSFVPAAEPPSPIDLDVHTIPARGDEPEHEHHDVRYLLVAAPDQRLRKSSESYDLAWFDWSELDRVASDRSVRRLADKARRILLAR